MKIRGIDIELHPDEDLSNHIRREKDFFEAEILDYLADYHQVQETIVDIGANIGNHSLYFVNFLKYARLVCIEPVPDNFFLLRKNLKSYKNIGFVNAAASDTTHEDLRMTINRGNMGASEVHPGGNLVVKAVSIDKMALKNVTLMKIDVEGHEPSVLSGAMDTIYRFHPLILIEDWEKQYHKLLPSYTLEKAWDHHHTYLYKWDVYAGIYGEN